MKKKWTKMLSGLLCVAMLAAMAIPASAAGYATSESGKNNEGVSYTVKYPKVYGIINAEINMVDDSEDGTGTIVKKVQLPVMASGEAFELVFTSGLTSTRCPDCDKPYPDPNEKKEPSDSMANGKLYDGPCIHVILLSNRYSINGEYSELKDTFEWDTNMSGTPSKTPNTLLLDYDETSVGLCRLGSLMIDASTHFSYAPGNSRYVAGGDNSYADFVTSDNFKLGYYLRLPKATIDKMDFGKTYNTKELEALIKGENAKQGLTFRVNEKSNAQLDNGYGYSYTLTNHTTAPIKKYAALITYNPEMVRETKHDFEQKKRVVVPNGAVEFHGQIHAIDIDLAAGASIEKPIVSYYGAISTMQPLWIDFDSLAERDSFLKDRVFGEISTSDIQGYHLIDQQSGAAWMKDMLGIAIMPAK